MFLSYEYYILPYTNTVVKHDFKYFIFFSEGMGPPRQKWQGPMKVIVGPSLSTFLKDILFRRSL